jgi:hypothetical protein
MKRRLFTILAVVSLLMCVATAVFALRTYSGEEFIRLSGPHLRDASPLAAAGGYEGRSCYQAVTQSRGDCWYRPRGDEPEASHGCYGRPVLVRPLFTSCLSAFVPSCLRAL